MDFKQYEKLINDKLRKYTLEYAKKTEQTNIIPFGIGLDKFRGGGAPRDHPMIGTDSRTYAPYLMLKIILSVFLTQSEEKRNHRVLLIKMFMILVMDFVMDLLELLKCSAMLHRQ